MKMEETGVVVGSDVQYRHQSKLLVVFACISIVTAIILLGCNPALPAATENRHTTTESQWWPDASKVCVYSRSSLEGGVTISIPSGDLRIVPFEITHGEGIGTFAITAVSGGGFRPPGAYDGARPQPVPHAPQPARRWVDRTAPDQDPGDKQAQRATACCRTVEAHHGIAVACRRACPPGAQVRACRPAPQLLAGRPRHRVSYGTGLGDGGGDHRPSGRGGIRHRTPRRTSSGWSIWTVSIRPTSCSSAKADRVS